jgi:hypothetical protein
MVSKFAFKFNLNHYSVDGAEWTMPVVLAEQGGGFPLVTAGLYKLNLVDP